MANCFAAIEHHKTGRDIPMVGVHSAGWLLLWHCGCVVDVIVVVGELI